MATINPLAATNRIADRYRGYLVSTYAPRDPRLRAEFLKALYSGFDLSRGPFLQASPAYEAGASLSDMISAGSISDDFARLPSDVFPVDRPLRWHQQAAIEKAVHLKRNLVVATGTGSGKTECFLFPILDSLLREASSGTLVAPGVRALLLYPMNALANDQVKRLRRLLAPFPEITFGRYVGETKQGKKEAETDFRSRYPGEPRIENELLSREEMQAAPPRLLLTNYAMLEYLLLRPADSPLFDGPHGGRWRFLVLDEAHVYNGAQGTEVAMLLRRLRERVANGNRRRWQCFATSATLGAGAKDRPALIEFATRLFDEPFEWSDGDQSRQDIIEARHLPMALPDASVVASEELYSLLLRDVGGSSGDARSVLQIFAEHGFPVDDDDANATVGAILAKFLGMDRRVGLLLERLSNRTVELDVLARALFPVRGAAGLVELVQLGVTARTHPEASPLIPARYHFFLRALEGAFVCLHPAHETTEPRIRLGRHEACPSCSGRRQSVMFEVGTCRRCRAEYLIGEIDEATAALRQANRFAAGRCYVLLGRAAQEEDDDQATLDVDLGPDQVERHLCPGCGVISELPSGSCQCNHPPQRLAVAVARPSPQSQLLHRCIACDARTNGEIVARFETGSDAPVAVVATDLYQELPPSSDGVQAHQVGEGRKLLTFADSRQDAAFFAPYLDRTYGRSVRRRLIADAIQRLAGQEPRLEDLILPIQQEAEARFVLDSSESRVANRAAVATWLMQELLSFDRRSNLEGTATAEIRLAVPRHYQPPPGLTTLGFTADEATTLLTTLLSSLRDSGAVTVPEGVDIRDDAFAPRNRDFGVRESGSSGGVLSWMPSDRSSNRRLNYLQRLFKARQLVRDPRAVLREIWVYLVDAASPWKQALIHTHDKTGGPLWRLNHQAFVFDAIAKDRQVFECTRCRQIWWAMVAGICPAYRCDGVVKPLSAAANLRDDHYARLYRDLEPIGMAVQEHTAQFAAAKASRIQDQFVAGTVNVLSCSTTFEMGVDVGDVQAVLMRNVPPSPANYVQRAGRAGRRVDAAALITTFAQRRSHDLSYYANPRRLVDGTIAPPRILLENSAIVRRHVHAVAFAMFERAVGAHRTVADFFNRPEPNGVLPADAFGAWLRSRPVALAAALERIVPSGVQRALDVDGWGWVDALFEATPADPSHGWFTRAKEEIREDLRDLGAMIEEAAAKKDYRQADRLDKLQKTLSSRHLLSYLASRNVLPKYGFPVDVVELNLGRSGDADAAELDLTRDLALAISEYAPGGQVVAGKALWDSVGLGTRQDRAWPRYEWAICRQCKAFRYRLESIDPACPGCGATDASKRGQFVIPVFGFVGRRSLGAVGETRPVRLSHVESHFGSYKDEAPDWIIAAELSRRVVVRYRRSRQGRITILNLGPAGRGFRICEWCGYGEPAPMAPLAPAARGRAAKAVEHEDPRRPGRKCKGQLTHRHLGHEFLTDTVEVSIGGSIADDESRSTLYALLDGVRCLDIDRDDVEGTISYGASGGPPSFVLYDAVPGGAGHAHRIAERLPDLVAAAFERVQSCECGEETSCYNCLRNYRNQIWHELLRRDAAIRVLAPLVGA